MAGVFTIPPHLDFLRSLAEGLLRDDLEALAGTRILLPSRRACLGMREAFLSAAGGKALLLPRMEPIGEVDTDELFLDPSLNLELPRGIEGIERQVLLTRLVLARGGTTHEQAVRLAGALGQFLDELENEGIDLDQLEGLVPDELAEHWQVTLDFLKILRTAWPELLRARGAIGAAERRARLLDLVGERWRRQPPEDRIIAAGITGTIPAVARLLSVIAELPRGRVVLPGLDRELEPPDWAAIGPAHPQYAMKRLLDRIGCERLAVAEWPAPRTDGTSVARASLWREAMRPARGRLERPSLTIPREALAGLTVTGHRDLAGEAVEIALRIRAALEDPQRTVALVTPNRHLARRVVAELRRWGIAAEDSAGIPLDQSPPGSFLLLCAHLLADDAAPATLLACFKHPLASGGLDQGGFRRHVRALERALLRGPRRPGGLVGLVRALDDREEPGWPAPISPGEMRAWLASVEREARPFREQATRPLAPFRDLLRAHLGFAEFLARNAAGDSEELWAREAGQAAHTFMASLEEVAEELGGTPASAYPAILAVTMGQVTVRPQQPGHPRVAILGQLESRLQQPDLALIGGLQEGVWPATIDSGPWLNRRMRQLLGLPAVEQAIGIAAHDFVQAAMAPEVVLSHSVKDVTGAPTTPSRWVQRLSAVLRAAGSAEQVQPERCWAAWAAALDATEGPPAPGHPPAPRPPLKARPRELWATDIELLNRNPYGFYARRILGLRKLEPIDADPGGAERGQIIHEILHGFVSQHPHELPDQPMRELLALARAAFARFDSRPEIRTIWWPRFLRIADWFLTQENRRRAEIDRVLTEVEGTLILDVPGGPVRIRARADRIEVARTGNLSIVDYKTGALPSTGHVELGLSPQLPIEALIAAAGGFGEVPTAENAEMLYWRLRGGEPAGEARKAAGACDLTSLLAAAREGVERLVRHFDDPETAYIAVPRPEIAPDFDDYAHLARIAEWRGLADATPLRDFAPASAKVRQ
jgi:ATP-dependent helicase/nuclease subunit B